MEKETGHFNLFPLLTYVAEHPALPSILDKGKKSKSISYQTEVGKLLKNADVPKKGGWYVWGRFNDAGYWESIYVGMTSLGKTSNLRARLSDEFKNENISIFATVYGRYWITAEAKKMYKKHFKRGKRDYTAEIERSLRKTGTHFVMWTVAPEGMTEKKDIKLVETALINIFRPGFNMKRQKIDPKALYEDSKVYPIVIALEKEIGEILKEKIKLGEEGKMQDIKV